MVKMMLLHRFSKTYLLEYEEEQYSIFFFRDITEEKNNEKQKAMMEAHFRKRQRMEALGTFAGGYRP